MVAAQGLPWGTVGQASMLYCNGSGTIGDSKIYINGPTSGTATTKVYFTGDLTLSGSTILNIAGNVEVYVTGKLEMTNGAQIVTAANSNVVFKLGKFVNFNSNAKITSGTNSVLAILIDDDVQFTNNIVINKALIMATGNVALNSYANVTGAIIGTGAGSTITMSNQSQVTYDKATIELVWNYISDQVSISGSGSGGVGPVEWQNL